MSRVTGRWRGAALGSAALAAGAVVLLGSRLAVDEQPPLDHWVRRRTSTPGPRRVSKLAAPLFPLGLPGGYITISYLLARSLRRRRRSGGPAIVTAAWAGWLVHRGLKLVFVRERPARPGQRRRLDSYPSGHTTGTTALAVTAARVLARHGLVSRRRAALIGLGAPVVMGVYRLIDDEHWATDVIGGWLLGGSIALTCDALLGERGGGADATRGPAVKRRGSRPRVRRERPTS
ncbi:MAG TPA: phosphatase PAP2 family protein [Gemmatimonadaceae bacterium]|nr:phosphatase PAP2 family protein [Gemmatimonadaceae bacterium]